MEVFIKFHSFGIKMIIGNLGYGEVQSIQRDRLKRGPIQQPNYQLSPKTYWESYLMGNLSPQFQQRVLLQYNSLPYWPQNKNNLQKLYNI